MGIVSRIRRICQGKKIAITALASEIGVSKNSIYAWDNNEPSAEKISNTARFLGVSTDYLMGLTDNPLPHNIELTASTIKIMTTSEQLGLSEKATDITVAFMIMLSKALDNKQG